MAHVTGPLDWVEAQPDAARLRRKHARLWGLDEDSHVVRGLPGALTAAQEAGLAAVLKKDAAASARAVNDLLVLPPRSHTRAQWRIGAEYEDREGVSTLIPRRESAPVFRTSEPVSRALGGAFGGVAAVTVGSTATAVIAVPDGGLIAAGVLLVAGLVAGVPLGRAWWQARGQTTRTAETYRRIATLVWQALRGAERVADVDSTFVVTEGPERGGLTSVQIEVGEASPADQAMFAETMCELFGVVRTQRFVLETGRGGRSAVVRAVLGFGARESQYLSVPAAIGRRKAGAQAFAAAWEREVGPCVLHAMDNPDALAVIARARRNSGGSVTPTIREGWR